MDADCASPIEIRITPGALTKGFLALTMVGFLTGCLVGTAARAASASYNDVLFAQAFHAAQPASLNGSGMSGSSVKKAMLR